jgi:sialate O-acetylesterase
MMKLKTMVVVVCICLFSQLGLAGELRLPLMFSEGMVLQREMNVPVWGWGTKGAEVRIRVIGRNVENIADQKTTVKEDGAWKVILPPMKAGGRYSFLAEMGEDKILFNNVYVGEVWLTCGQSNMEWPIELTPNIKEARENADKYPLIRHLRIGHRLTRKIPLNQPPQDIGSYWGRASWEDAAFVIHLSSRTDIPGCQAAVPYYFARELTRHFDGKVAVGMVDVAQILPVETWVSDVTMGTVDALKPLRGQDTASQGYNANIVPLAPFAVRGVLYYQGEMNGGRHVVYRAGLEAMISDWRNLWQRPDLPFILVQLPGFIKQDEKVKTDLDMDEKSLAVFNKENNDHCFCDLREAALDVWEKIPNTGMAVTLDLGEKWDLHPPRKLEVAQRLFLQALKVAYGQDIDAFSPIPEKYEPLADGFKIMFKYAGKGLVLKPGKGNTTSFELQGADGQWKPAAAEIKGNTAVVTAAGLGKVQAVRYGWRGFPEVTLYTVDGLPASPFRSK